VSRAYDQRRAMRERERQRNLCGETLDAFHARETPVRTPPGAGIAVTRCRKTHDLFDDMTDRERKGGPSFFHLLMRRG